MPVMAPTVEMFQSEESIATVALSLPIVVAPVEESVVNAPVEAVVAPTEALFTVPPEIVGEVKVLLVKDSIPASVASVPVVGSVTLVAAVVVKVSALAPEVVNAAAVVKVPPKSIVVPVPCKVLFASVTVSVREVVPPAMVKPSVAADSVKPLIVPVAVRLPVVPASTIVTKSFPDVSSIVSVPVDPSKIRTPSNSAKFPPIESALVNCASDTSMPVVIAPVDEPRISSAVVSALSSAFSSTSNRSVVPPVADSFFITRPRCTVVSVVASLVSESVSPSTAAAVAPVFHEKVVAYSAIASESAASGAVRSSHADEPLPPTRLAYAPPCCDTRKALVVESK